MDLKLKGKIAIVTGASGGIGSGCARVLAQEGVNVVVNYKSNSARAQEIVEEIIDKYGVRAIAVQADIGIEAEIIKLFEKTMKEFGTVDILINNAAVLAPKYTEVPIEKFNIEDFRVSEAVMVEGAFVTCREFVKIVRAQSKGGHIVNVLSKSAFWSSSIYNTTYAACKGANGVFTQALAHELADEGIFVNAIIPGYVAKPNMDKESERYKNKIKLIPMGRFGEPEEMGYIIAFLCSERACQINGHNVDCTGGTMNGDFVPKI